MQVFCDNFGREEPGLHDDFSRCSRALVKKDSDVLHGPLERVACTACPTRCTCVIVRCSDCGRVGEPLAFHRTWRVSAAAAAATSTGSKLAKRQFLASWGQSSQPSLVPELVPDVMLRICALTSAKDKMAVLRGLSKGWKAAVRAAGTCRLVVQPPATAWPSDEVALAQAKSLLKLKHAGAYVTWRECAGLGMLEDLRPQRLDVHDHEDEAIPDGTYWDNDTWFTRVGALQSVTTLCAVHLNNVWRDDPTTLPNVMKGLAATVQSLGWHCPLVRWPRALSVIASFRCLVRLELVVCPEMVVSMYSQHDEVVPYGAANLSPNQREGFFEWLMILAGLEQLRELSLTSGSDFGDWDVDCDRHLIQGALRGLGHITQLRVLHCTFLAVWDESNAKECALMLRRLANLEELDGDLYFSSGAESDSFWTMLNTGGGAPKLLRLALAASECEEDFLRSMMRSCCECFPALQHLYFNGGDLYHPLHFYVPIFGALQQCKSLVTFSADLEAHFQGDGEDGLFRTGKQQVEEVADDMQRALGRIHFGGRYKCGPGWTFTHSTLLDDPRSSRSLGVGYSTEGCRFDLEQERKARAL